MGTVKLPPDLCGNYEIVLMILSIMVILTHSYMSFQNMIIMLYVEYRL